MNKGKILCQYSLDKGYTHRIFFCTDINILAIKQDQNFFWNREIILTTCSRHISVSREKYSWGPIESISAHRSLFQVNEFLLRLFMVFEMLKIRNSMKVPFQCFYNLCPIYSTHETGQPYVLLDEDSSRLCKLYNFQPPLSLTSLFIAGPSYRKTNILGAKYTAIKIFQREARLLLTSLFRTWLANSVAQIGTSGKQDVNNSQYQ